MLYLAILGQNPELSLAELQAVYPSVKVISRSNETAFLESAEEVDISRLGGTPKLGLFVGEAETLEKAKHIIIEELMKLSAEKKIFFGLSFYNNSDRKKYERLGKEIKNALKDAGYKARWAVSRELALSSVYIKTNKLLTRGFDFNLLFHPHPSSPSERGRIKEGVSIFKTIAIQDFADYEFRDMRRPARDLYSGMTPPKLAKILINLSFSPSLEGEKPKAEGVLENNFLDPFCGSGTFLTEAALLGFKNISGSDISEKAVSDSQKNFSWFKNEYKSSTEAEIKMCDIKNIFKCWTKKFNNIATEPYLGPPIRGALTVSQAQKLQKELSELYGIYLKNLSSVLGDGGRLVLIVPFFITREKTFRLSLQIKQNGLKAVREPILYSRPDQKVGREIYVFEKL